MNEEEIMRTTAVFKALSDPNRLRIFAELMAGDTCNCELKEKLGLAPNLLSHHLKVLESAGLVNSRRDVVDGRWIYYTADRHHINAWHQWLADFFNPMRICSRPLCGPEGQSVVAVASNTD
ncbi:MAG: metalloregulator ArsR/SmtB family transcription factor [Candidatus Promineifilaceae bacterium]|nr:metalloregulator ArsR/SmtB family transcription factor [Candidatus Promineifilaceae bacterium]